MVSPEQVAAVELAALLDTIYADLWVNDHKQARLEAPEVAARLIAAGVTLTPADAPSDLPTITELAGALYQTDPPESWMRTGTDEYRKRAEAMLTFIAEDRAALSGDRPSPEANPTHGCKRLGTDLDCDPGCISSCVASPATAPAEGLNVELLADAMRDSFGVKWPVAWVRNGENFDWIARQIAAEYARLAPDSAQVAKLSSSAQPPDSAQEAE